MVEFTVPIIILMGIFGVVLLCGGLYAFLWMKIRHKATVVHEVEDTIDAYSQPGAVPITGDLKAVLPTLEASVEEDPEEHERRKKKLQHILRHTVEADRVIRTLRKQRDDGSAILRTDSKSAGDLLSELRQQREMERVAPQPRADDGSQGLSGQSGLMAPMRSGFVDVDAPALKWESHSWDAEELHETVSHFPANASPGRRVSLAMSISEEDNPV